MNALGGSRTCQHQGPHSCSKFVALARSRRPVCPASLARCRGAADNKPPSVACPPTALESRFQSATMLGGCCVSFACRVSETGGVQRHDRVGRRVGRSTRPALELQGRGYFVRGLRRRGTALILLRENFSPTAHVWHERCDLEFAVLVLESRKENKVSALEMAERGSRPRWLHLPFVLEHPRH